MFGWKKPKTADTSGSSAIAEASYDPGTKRMILYFTSNPDKGFTFARVPQDVWDGFVRAESKGKFYAANIRGRYQDD